MGTGLNVYTGVTVDGDGRNESIIASNAVVPVSGSTGRSAVILSTK